MGDKSAPEVVEVTGTETEGGTASIAAQPGDVRWVYEHFGDEPGTEGEAPSKGARGLLMAARKDEKAYLRVLDIIHPKDAGEGADDSSVALLDLEQRIQSEWGAVAGVLQLATRRPEVIPELVEFCRLWRKAHPAKVTERQRRGLEKVEGNTPQDGEVPA